jgi:hypothetical protein
MGGYLVLPDGAGGVTIGASLSPTIILYEDGGSAPTVASISPDFGSSAGATSVTIGGSGFTGATAVTIGGTAVASFSVVSDVEITATTAASTVANADVVVTTTSGSGTLSGGFTYMPSSGWTLAATTDTGVTTSSGLVTAWADQSGAGNDFTEDTADGFAQPTYTAGSPSFITFTGTSSTGLICVNPLSSVFASDGSAYSLYAVILPTSANPGIWEAFDAIFGDTNVPSATFFGYYEMGVIGPGGSPANSVVVDAYSTGDQVVYTTGGLNFTDIIMASSLMSEATSLDVAVNSGSTYSGTQASPGAIGFVGNQPGIGTNFSAYLTGNVYAVLAWNRRLDPTEHGVVSNYLKNKYSIPNW